MITGNMSTTIITQHNIRTIIEIAKDAVKNGCDDGYPLPFSHIL